MYDLVIEIGFIRLRLSSYQLSLIIKNNNTILLPLVKLTAAASVHQTKFTLSLR